MVIKEQDNENIYISVITVCYNCIDEIEKTIQSVLSQKSRNFEYLIIDGASTDGTVDVIKRYEEKFDENSIPYSYYSEKDNGIYEAMNKGTQKAKGSYLNFLNAGDYYFSDESLAHMNIKNGNSSVIYGDFVDQIYNLRKIIKAKPLSEITKGMIFSHQSAFIRKEVLIHRPYDTSYKIAGDYDFFLYCYKAGIGFEYVPYPFSVFVRGGVSSNSDNHVILEELKTRNLNNYMTDDFYKDAVEKICNPSFFNKSKSKIKQLMPKFIYKFYLYIKYLHAGYSFGKNFFD